MYIIIHIEVLTKQTVFSIKKVSRVMKKMRAMTHGKTKVRCDMMANKYKYRGL